jgi:hypothetical protein
MSATNKTVKPGKPSPYAIHVDAQPIAGTNLHRVYEGNTGRREIRPAYRGDGGLAKACEEADSLGLTCIEFGDVTYDKIGGKWLPLILD